MLTKFMKECSELLWLRGLQAVLKTALKENPDIPGSASATWERHLLNHMKRTKDKADESLKLRN